MLGPQINIDNSIVIRELELSDASHWLKWDNDPTAQKFMPEPFEIQTLDDEKEFYEEAKDEEDGVYWTIEDITTKQPIGMVSLTEISKHHGIGEIGIIIGNSDYHGKGIATKVVGAVIEYAKSSNLRRITAEYEEGNIGMQKALEKNGFTLEAKCEQSRMKNGDPINTYRYYKLI
jgi:RimJ/RimL family protein N-acetyltransferase